MKNPVKTILYEKDIKCPQLAKKTGLAYNTVYLAATGLTGTPRHETMEKIAEFANKDVKKFKEEWKQWRTETTELD